MVLDAYQMSKTALPNSRARWARKLPAAKVTVSTKGISDLVDPASLTEPAEKVIVAGEEGEIRVAVLRGSVSQQAQVVAVSIVGAWTGRSLEHL